MEEQGGEEGEGEVRSYKILVLGNSGAGKTSLVRRSVRDYFSRDYRWRAMEDWATSHTLPATSSQIPRATIGVDFSLKLLTWSHNLQLRLELWDLAGQDRWVWFSFASFVRWFKGLKVS